MDNGKSKYVTKKIKVYGIVQGVGFRPLVYRIAKNLEAAGSVRNVGGYVEIILQAAKEALEQFVSVLKSGNNISGYEIVKLEVEDHPSIDDKDFVIIGSGESQEISIIPPDLPVCPACQKELYRQEDRRFLNPFISCMACGPRYTIIEEVPYDRDNTTMTDFTMCDSCREEYTSPEDRRFHAQTISCNDCGPYLIYMENPTKKENQIKQEYVINQEKQINQKSLIYQEHQIKLEHQILKDNRLRPEDSTVVEEDSRITTSPVRSDYVELEALEKAVSVLKSGGIIAVKGIGGYHLVCSPFMEETVQNLRKLKGREEKPFAVMFESLASIREYCQVSEEEQALLETKARPIVLLYMHNNTLAPSVNKGSIYCGSFLPYTPLQLLLTHHCGPLIMTSANLSDKPIIREDAAILSLQSSYLEGVLYNTRRIVRSVDDSVAKVIDGKPQLIRRSRGYVPYPVFLAQDRTDNRIDKNPVIFAAGGDLKAAFCLYQNGSAVVSQHFGDLEEADVYEEYQKSYADLSRLLKMNPNLAVCDLHPRYYSSEFTKRLGLPLLQVQHHHAHIASVMAEHDLKGKVIGVAFDGTGYGTDGCVWGGEFLICEEAEFIRAGKLSYTPMLGGDESMRDALKTAACFLLEAGLEEYIEDDRKEIIKAALLHKINTVKTSSMGRLFDAVASILGIGQVNRYEGECAACLEREAVLALRAGKAPEKLNFAIDEKSGIIEMDPRPVLEALCRLRETVDIGSLALGFHYALAASVGEICDRIRKNCGSNTVALSGGVFQNTVLSERTLQELRQKGFEVYVNLAVPPNDGGVSLGQTYIGLKSKIPG